MQREGSFGGRDNQKGKKSRSSGEVETHGEDIAFVVAKNDVSRSKPPCAAVGAPHKVTRPPAWSYLMTPHINALMEKIRELEADLDAEIAQRRIELHVGMEKGRVFFEEEILRRHRELRTRLSTYIVNAHPLVMLTAPVIYAMIIPFVFLDVFVTIYQTVCFPVYGIPKVRRGDYLVFDRHHLAYLNALEIINCAYCSYANGLIAYVREIAGRTERHWCPIKHARRVIVAHPRYADFVDYGDADAYRKLSAQIGDPNKPED